jgi:hypothetical protein
MSGEKQTPKISAGHASAIARLGLAELRAALYSESNIAQSAQYGIFGTRTSGEVVQERGTWGRDLDEQQPSAIAERVQCGQGADKVPEHETREPDRE